MIVRGDEEIPGKLPYMQVRYKVHVAWIEACDPETDPWDYACVCAAVIGLCWQGPPLDCSTWRQCGRDVVEYGEAVTDALLRDGWEPREIIRIGCFWFFSRLSSLLYSVTVLIFTI